MARYDDFDRAAWAARRRGRASVDSFVGTVQHDELIEIYCPLAELIAARAGDAAPFVVSITGSVAVGKSAAAEALVAAFAVEGLGSPVAIVSTDGFLFPNAELQARGLIERKGFPESFDVDALAAFLAAVRAGDPDASAPVYSHVTYDVVTGERVAIGRPAVLVLEGLPLALEHVDLSIYVDAVDDDIEQWYVERFHRLCAEANTDDQSFFRLFRGYSIEQLDAIGHQVWQQINLVNLEEHIRPMRDRCDVILEKGHDHAVRRVRVRID